MRRGPAFTLIELLTVVAISTVLLSVGGRLFTDGWRALRRSIEQAEANQIVLLLMERWQRTLGSTDPGEWKAGGTAFSAGPRSVTWEEGRLVFARGASRTPVALPAGMRCEFAVERNGSEPPCAVLNLRWTSWRMDRPKQSRVRLVVCGGRG